MSRRAAEASWRCVLRGDAPPVAMIAEGTPVVADPAPGVVTGVPVNGLEPAPPELSGDEERHRQRSGVQRAGVPPSESTDAPAVLGHPPVPVMQRESDASTVVDESVTLPAAPNAAVEVPPGCEPGGNYIRQEYIGPISTIFAIVFLLFFWPLFAAPFCCPCVAT